MALRVALRSLSRNINNFNHPRCEFKNARKFSINISYLAEKRFSEKHEWVEVTGDKGKIGITYYAQESLGDIVYAQLPELGTDVSIGEECGALESVKAASELYSPVSGIVSMTNPDVEEQPGLINESCYDKGWLFEVELTKTEELADLMDESAYEKFLRSIDTEE